MKKRVLIEILEETRGSEDGVTVRTFPKGPAETTEALAEVFIKELKVAKAKKAAPAPKED
jgi:hypothetical protein